MSTTVDYKGVLLPNVYGLPVFASNYKDGNRPADTTPNAFTFTDQTNVALNTDIISNAITVTGINAATAISITGGSYKIDSGSYTTSAGTVTNGQSVTVKAHSSSSNSTAVNAVLTIGGVSDTFTVTTTSGVGSLLFTDDFSSGDFSKQLNGSNFWAGNTNCSVISGFSPAGDTGHCVRFNCSITETAVSELRYNLGDEYQELYFVWHIYYPDGTEATDRGERVVQTGSNNKHFRCWADTEGGSGNGDDPRFGMSYYAVSPSGDAQVGAQAGVFPVDDPASTSQVPVADPAFADAIIDAHRGTWVKEKIRIKAGTLAGHPNAEFQYWVNDVEKWNLSGLDAYDPAGVFFGMRKGYLQGAIDHLYSNTPTYIYIGDFAVSDANDI